MRFNKWRPAAVPVTITVILIAVLSLLALAAFAGTDSGPGTNADPLVTQSYVDGKMSWEVAELRAGQELTGQAGSEFIVRRGNALVIDRTGNGVPDLTAGADIFNGQRADLNHLLIFPKDDGRGVRAVDFAVVMYRGGSKQR